MSLPKVGLIIGHKPTSMGACNDKFCEFAFNDLLGKHIVDMLEGVKSVIIYRATYKKLPALVNRYNVDFFVSLHCNSFNKKVSGTEVLYHHRSKTSKRIALIFQDQLVNALKLRDRGIKPVTTEDKGGYLLKYTKAPGVLAEPFFMDNPNDLKQAQEKYESLIAGYAGAIMETAACLNL